MPDVTLVEAGRLALQQEMRRDPRIWVLGEDVARGGLWGQYRDMLAEFGALGIWTGWLAMLLFVPLALTSNNAAMRKLKAGWKKLQRLVYPTAILVLIHWIFVHNNLGQALVHFIPLALLIAARAFSLPTPLNKGV